MICIRYKDFSAGTHDATGLHGRAERGPHGVTVYLVPGLTACQRRAVIRRLRQEASRYVGPALPLPQLAVALGLDRVRSAARVTGAVVRLHPAVTLLPGALVAVLMTLFVIASADGPGLTAGPPPVLADAAAFGPGMPQQVSEAVVPARRSAPSRTGLVTGHPTLIAQSRARRWNRPVFLYRRPGARCGCPAVLIGPRPAWFSGQPACGRSPSTLAPDTAHLPDPRAFAT